MTNNPDFQPEFGPNGAVINAPSMTPEMREKIKRSASLPSAQEALTHLRPFFLVIVLSSLLVVFARPLRECLTGSPWWAGAFTGALAMFAIVVFWRFGHSILERWEILPGQKRLLSVPTWARIMIAVSDIAMGLCFGLGQLNFVTDFNSERVLLSLAAFAAAIVAAFVAWSMRWLADETKWAWRTDRLAALAPPGEHHEQGRQQHADNAR